MAPPRNYTMQLFSVMAESLLTGVYGSLVVLVIWILVTHHRSMSMAHKILFGACFVMFLIASAHLALLMHEASNGLLPTPAVGKALIILGSFQFVISDLILIWRVWVIWAHSYLIVAVPFLLMVLASGFSLSNVERGSRGSFYKITPSLLVVANTSLCTLLIAGRIWYMQHCLRKAKKGVMSSFNNYTGAVALMVESGALYVATQLVCLILDNNDNPGLSVMLNLAMPLIGIIPTLIIVFVHFDMVPGTTTTKIYANRFSCRSTSPVALDTIVCTVSTRSDRVVFSDDLERGSIHDDGEGQSLQQH